MPKVFVCYAHENDGHKAAVQALAGLLQSHGITVTLDRWVGSDRQDWDHWMRQAVRRSDFVLVIASKKVQLLGDGDMPEGFHGLRAELDLLRELYNGSPYEWRRRILPVVLPGRSISEIPTFLQPYNADHYIVSDLTAAGVEDLLRPLTGRSAPPRPDRVSPPLSTPSPDGIARHWIVSARGSGLSDNEFWFTGRQGALARISEFTDGRSSGLLVVTGRFWRRSRPALPAGGARPTTPTM